MKSILLLTILFLLFAFITNLSLVFSESEVVDDKGRPVFPYRKYYILPVIVPGGGLEFGKTNYSNCPTTVVQNPSQFVIGIPVIFSFPSPVGPGLIFTNNAILIQFAEKPDCVQSSKWLVYVDNVTQKKFIGVRGPENYSGMKVLNGTFSLRNFKQYRTIYNIQFCTKRPQNCWDIGSYYNGEGGRPLILPAQKALDVMFVPAISYEAGNY